MQQHASISNKHASQACVCKQHGFQRPWVVRSFVFYTPEYMTQRANTSTYVVDTKAVSACTPDVCKNAKHLQQQWNINICHRRSAFKVAIACQNTAAEPPELTPKISRNPSASLTDGSARPASSPHPLTRSLHLLPLLRSWTYDVRVLWPAIPTR